MVRRESGAATKPLSAALRRRRRYINNSYLEALECVLRHVKKDQAGQLPAIALDASGPLVY